MRSCSNRVHQTSNGRVALVSGFGSHEGIAFACAAELALRGARVAGASDHPSAIILHRALGVVSASRARFVDTFATTSTAFPAPATPAPLTRRFATAVHRTQARTGYRWSARDTQRMRRLV